MNFQMGEAGPRGWGRAGEGQTSVLLALHPALFQEDRLCKDGHPLQPGSATAGCTNLPSGAITAIPRWGQRPEASVF